MTILLVAGFPEATIQGISGHRDTFMSLFMLPGASTGIAQSMDNPLGLSLSPSLPILPPWAASGHYAGICVIRRRWAAEKVVFTSGLTFQMLGG